MKNNQVQLSISNDLQGFIPVSIDFNRLDEITCSKNYSPALFKNSYRSRSNYIEARLCILDFDDNLTLENAKNIFAEYRALIVTTRSHQKAEKKGKAIEKQDKFRVVLVFSEIITTHEIYTDVMKAITQEYKSDVSCTDGARFFYPNPYQKIWYSTGSRMIDVTSYCKKYSTNKRIFPKLVKNSTTSTVNEDNPLLIDNSNNKLLASQWAEIIEDKTVSIHCPNDEHEDVNPSAFISKSTKYENKIYIYCHKCGQIGLYPKTTISTQGEK